MKQKISSKKNQSSNIEFWAKICDSFLLLSFSVSLFLSVPVSCAFCEAFRDSRFVYVVEWLGGWFGDDWMVVTSRGAQPRDTTDNKKEKKT